MQFRQAMASVKGDEPSKAGYNNNNFNPSMDYSEPADDRVACNFCGRKFNEHAADRHIPVCEQKHKKEMMKNGIGI